MNYIFPLIILSTNAEEQKKVVKDFQHDENIHCEREIYYSKFAKDHFFLLKYFCISRKLHKYFCVS